MAADKDCTDRVEEGEAGRVVAGHKGIAGRTGIVRRALAGLLGTGQVGEHKAAVVVRMEMGQRVRIGLGLKGSRLQAEVADHKEHHKAVVDLVGHKLVGGHQDKAGFRTDWAVVARKDPAEAVHKAMAAHKVHSDHKPHKQQAD